MMVSYSKWGFLKTPSRNEQDSSLDFTLFHSPNFVLGAQGLTKYPYGHDQNSQVSTFCSEFVAVHTVLA